MEQKEVWINKNTSIPVIDNNEEIYYPINFIMRNILLKSTGSAGIIKKYQNDIKKYSIDFSKYNGGKQNTNCIPEKVLKEVLINSKIGGLSIEQKKAMNELLAYLHMDLINEDNRFINYIPTENIKKYDIYTYDCITYILKDNPDIIWQKCSKCGNYYPYHKNFYFENQHSGKGYDLNTVCKKCISNSLFTHPNKEMMIIYKNYGSKIFKLYKEHNTIEIYKHWIVSNKKQIPKIINNTEDKIKIVKYYYDKGTFDKYDEITEGSVTKVCKFSTVGLMRLINKEIFGVSIIDTIDDARKIFFNYLDKENIKYEGDNKYKLQAEEIIKSTKLRGYVNKKCNKNNLTFLMNMFDNAVAYKFKTTGNKYWAVKENRIKALKYLIEEDMKLELNKIPLYLTLTSLRNCGTTTLYNICKKYYKSLWEWVDEIYPNEFDERDFNIHIIRNNFDSMEECEIHDILKQHFKNVIYNARNTENTIHINGMIPDWVIFTDNKCYLVEYFGIAPETTSYNTRIEYYKNKMKSKLEKYKYIDGYGKLFLYPEDLKHSFEGVVEKIKLIS